jgi:LysR family hydrogen peroxide-inducible transcriptional activator
MVGRVAITLRQLEYAVAVAERASFSAAARACHVSQPGLSAQIRELETQLGAPLFERGRRRVLLTGCGEAVVARARAILAGVADLEAAARCGARPLEGLLRMGVIPTVAPYLLPRVLPAVRRALPKLELRLHEAPTEDLVRLALDGDLDLLLLALEADLDGLVTHPLFRDPFVAVFPAGHRLAKRRTLRESDLDSAEILLLADGHCLREQVLDVCAKAGGGGAGGRRSGAPAGPRDDFRATSLPTLVQMVAGGAGTTLLPRLALRVEARHRDLATVPFRQPEPARTIGLAWRGSSPHADAYRALGALLVPRGEG